MVLESHDFPLFSIGPLVYCKRASSPIFTCPDMYFAADIVARLNRDFATYSSSPLALSSKG